MRGAVQRLVQYLVSVHDSSVPRRVLLGQGRQHVLERLRAALLAALLAEIRPRYHLGHDLDVAAAAECLPDEHHRRGRREDEVLLHSDLWRRRQRLSGIDALVARWRESLHKKAAIAVPCRSCGHLEELFIGLRV